jgi:LPXTG-motif cell wall-anchored protein
MSFRAQVIYVLVYLALLSPLSSFSSIDFSVYAEGSENPQVCPAGDVKYETDGGYEYSNQSGAVWVAGTTASWKASAGYTIDRVCLKAGQDLFYPNPERGSFATPKKGVSHVVLYTSKRNEPPEEPPKKEPKEGPKEEGEVLGEAVLPETGAYTLKLLGAAAFLGGGLLLRRKSARLLSSR